MRISSFVVRAVILLGMSAFQFFLGQHNGFRRGFADGLQDVTKRGVVVMQPLGEQKIEIDYHGGNEFRLSGFVEVADDRLGKYYVCAEKGRWGSAAIGFEEPRNSVELVPTDPIRDLDSRTLGVVRYVSRAR